MAITETSALQLAVLLSTCVLIEAGATGGGGGGGGIVREGFQYQCGIYDSSNSRCNYETGDNRCGDGEYGVHCVTGQSTGCSHCDDTGTAKNSNNEKQCTPAPDHECICKEGYVGQLCDQPMLRATCDAHSITVYISPYTVSPQPSNTQLDFRLYISGEDFTSPPTTNGCVIKKDSQPRERTVQYDGSTSNCNFVVQQEAVTGARILYTYYQHYASFIQPGDQVYKISCNPADSTDVITRLHVDESSFDPTLVVLESVTKLNNFIMSIKSGSSAPFQDIQDGVTLQMNDDMQLILQHTDDFTVTSCRASSDNIFTDSDPEFLENLCVPSGFDSRYSDSVQYNDGSHPSSQGGTGTNKVYRFPLRAWAMSAGAGSHNHQLYVQCTVCLGSSCAIQNPRDCVADKEYSARDLTAPLIEANNRLRGDNRRRRRQAEGEEVTLLNVKIQIGSRTTGSFPTDPNTTPSSSNTSSCYQQVSVILPIAMLAALLIAAIICIIFFCRFSLTELPSRSTNSDKTSDRSIGSTHAQYGQNGSHCERGVRYISRDYDDYEGQR